MAVVGYLLGAGASAECIPVVNGMAEDLEKIISEIEIALSDFDGDQYQLYGNKRKKFSSIGSV